MVRQVQKQALRAAAGDFRFPSVRCPAKAEEKKETYSGRTDRISQRTYCYLCLTGRFCSMSTLYQLWSLLFLPHCILPLSDYLSITDFLHSLHTQTEMDRAPILLPS